jgi:hypothetical protein
MTPSHKRTATQAALLSVFVFAPDASAATVTFTDKDAWERRTEILTEVTFEGIAAPGESVSFDTRRGVTLGGVNFVGQVDWGLCSVRVCDGGTYFRLSIHNPGQGAEGELIGPGSYFSWEDLIAVSRDGSLGVSLPEGRNAFGLDFRRYGSALTTTHVRIIFAGSDSFGELFSGMDDGFFGVVSEQPISSVVLYLRNIQNDSPDQGVILDNFAAGTATPIPEPGTFGMIIGPLVVIAYRYRCRFGRSLAGPQNQKARSLNTPGLNKIVFQRIYIKLGGRECMDPDSWRKHPMLRLADAFPAFGPRAYGRPG